MMNDKEELMSYALTLQEEVSEAIRLTGSEDGLPVILVDNLIKQLNKEGLIEKEKI